MSMVGYLNCSDLIFFLLLVQLRRTVEALALQVFVNLL